MAVPGVTQGTEMCQAYDGVSAELGAFCFPSSDTELSRDALGQVLNVKIRCGCSVMSCTIRLCNLISDHLAS